RPRAVVGAGVGERPEGEALAGPLGGGLVGSRGNGRCHVVHRHVGRVRADAAVLVPDLAAHMAGSVVRGGAGSGARSPEGAVSRAVIAVDGAVAPCCGVHNGPGRRRRQGQTDGRALVHGGGRAEGGRRRHVVHHDLEGGLAGAAVVVGDLNGDRVGAVVV